MLVTEPAGARYENREAVTTEEHLLERISALENRMARLNEKLERGLDLLLRQAQNSHFDRALLKALIGLLTTDKIVESDRLERLWIEKCQKETQQEQESEHREALRLRVLGNYHGADRALFEQLVNEGFLLIDDNQAAGGTRALRRALEMSPENVPLLSVLGEYFFKIGKSSRAREYLSRAHEILPRDRRLSLLLGLIYADEGDTKSAKTLLSRATSSGHSSFAAHYGLGRLFVAEENWRKALEEFKLALASKASPEAHYALACLYYQLGRDPLAEQHLREALAMDQHYAEALYLLGLVSARSGNKSVAGPLKQTANSMFDAALGQPSRKRAASRQGAIAPLFRIKSRGTLKLITGADRRLAEVLRQDALNPSKTSDVES